MFLGLGGCKMFMGLGCIGGEGEGLCLGVFVGGDCELGDKDLRICKVELGGEGD